MEGRNLESLIFSPQRLKKRPLSILRNRSWWRKFGPFLVWKEISHQDGSDGFSMFFYQECWDVIHEDTMKVFAEFHERGAICKGVNATFLVLLSKKNEAKELLDYQPISLTGSLYKIIAKCFCERKANIEWNFDSKCMCGWAKKSKGKRFSMQDWLWKG